MREILFRGKRFDKGEWVEGFLWKKKYNTNKLFISCFPDKDDNEEVFVVRPETVGQYTGLTDKNGTKIFEGDIVNCLTSDFDGSDKYVYNYKITDITDFEQMGFLDFCHEIEIIGNIHDNPKLLKESK